MTFGHKFYDHMLNIYDLCTTFMTKDKNIFMTLGHIVYEPKPKSFIFFLIDICLAICLKKIEDV